MADLVFDLSTAQLDITFEGCTFPAIIDPGEWLIPEADFICRRIGVTGIADLGPYVEAMNPAFIGGVVAVSARRAGFSDKIADIYDRVRVREFAEPMYAAIAAYKERVLAQRSAEEAGPGPSQAAGEPPAA